MGRGSEFGETDLSLTYRISEALGLCIASGARTVAVPGFAEPPDEVRSRGAELPARPRCRPRSLRPRRALVLAGVRSRARGARRVSALQPPLVRSRGPAKVCRLGEAEAATYLGRWPSPPTPSPPPTSCFSAAFSSCLVLTGPRFSPPPGSPLPPPGNFLIVSGQRPRFFRGPEPEHPAQNPA